MKKTFIRITLTAILCCINVLSLLATDQSGDRIEIDGQEWELLGKPIDFDSICYHKLRNFLPKSRSVSTGNWSGYTGYWTIEDDSLYLQKIEIEMYDHSKKQSYTIEYDAKALKEVFLPYYTRRGICAKWHNGRIRCGRGKALYYGGFGYKRNLPEEMVMELQQGKIVKEQTYHNFKRDGLKMRQIVAEVNKKFSTNDFPELSGKKQRVLFSIKNIELAPDGHFINCIANVKTTDEWLKDQEHPIIKALKNVLISIYPWEVLYIYGKYQAESPGWTWPLLISD